MTTSSHVRPQSQGQRPRGPRNGLWRVGTPAVLLICGVLFVTSAISSDGTDLRPGRYRDLSSVVRAESAQAEQLTDRVARLNAEIAGLSDGLGDDAVNDVSAAVEALRPPAGLTEVSGAGLTVTLSDSPDDVREGSDLNPNRFVVHQQDIQAVVNALWAGGASAISIQGQRIISTTGIKCEGNAILLQGIPYPQPYEITAIGSPASLRSSLDADGTVRAYRSDASDPAVAIGWSIREEAIATAPEYRGLLDLEHATPLG